MALSWQDPIFFNTPIPSSAQSPNPFDTPEATQRSKSLSDETRLRKKNKYKSSPQQNNPPRRNVSMVKQAFTNLKKLEAKKQNDVSELNHLKVLISPVDDEVKKHEKSETSEN